MKFRVCSRSTVLVLGVFLSVHGLGCSDEGAASGPSGSSVSSGSASGGSGGGSGGGDGGGGGSGGESAGGAGGGNGGSGGAGGASVPLAGFGAISGDCGLIDAMEIQSDSSYTFRDTIDFGMAMFDYNELSPGGKKIYDAGNLGGSSLESEIFSYEVLYRCELAALLKTEAEVSYQDPAGKKTDLLVDIDAFKLGVSVTRAYIFPPDTPYTEADAKTLLEKKLSDIQLSSANVTPGDAWEKQILHVLAYKPEFADTMEKAYASIDPVVRGDTILYITVTEGDDEFIY